MIAFRTSTRRAPLPSVLVPDSRPTSTIFVATERCEPQERPADADEALVLLRNVADELTDSEFPCAAGRDRPSGPSRS